MIIVEDERNSMDSAAIGVCEECGKEKRARRVFVGSQMMGGISRGSYLFCFDCSKPKIRWKKSSSGIIFESPAPTP